MSFYQANRIIKGINRHSAIRVGYIPLIDASPLLVAQEMGFFKKYGITVKLSQEAGWATIRDKIIFGELEAAHSLASLPFVINRGLACISHPIVTPFVFNMHGNCITLSNTLRERGVRDAISLRRVIKEDESKHRYVFGVVFPYSNHASLLRKWFRSGGINPDKEIQIVVVPPMQLYPNLKAGNIDGYCVGEPWNSMSVLSGVGWCPTISAMLDPFHPEKVLMSRVDFLRQRESEHAALVAGLIEGAIYCDNPKNREELVSLLTQPRFLNIAPKFLQNALSGQFNCGHGQTLCHDDVILFHRFGTNVPTVEKGLRVLEQMRNCGVALPENALPDSLASKIFRPDLFQQAMTLTQTQNEPRDSPHLFIHN